MVYAFIGIFAFVLIGTTTLFLFLAKDAIDEDHVNDYQSFNF